MSPKAHRTALLAGLASLVLFAGTDVAVHAARLHFNDSSSVPVGLYRETPDGSGKYSAFCLAPAVLRSAQQAGLQLNGGSCPGDVSPVLKVLIRATRSQPLTFSDHGFSVGGTLLPNTAPKPFSGTGKALTHYPFGTYIDGFWAISSYNRDSFDSRYFGPVDQAAIRFYATPVLTR